jgi:hypothetical protein
MGKRLTPTQWAEIGRRYTVGREPAKSLANEYGVSASSVYKRAARGDWPAAGGGTPTATADLAATVERLERVADRLETVLSPRGSNGS